ncbi:MAG: FTR1 family iron permease [Thaumarchaeota archaeon]|nr:FTR1 family iron permease [Nitrososphaerota archaeon]MDE0526091.1 FTR1 family iron permease [Nitrososphaerota archaeon]
MQPTPAAFYPIDAGLDVAHARLGAGDLEGAAHAAQFASEQFALGLESFRNIDRDATNNVHVTLLDIGATIGGAPAEQSADAVSEAIDDLGRFGMQGAADPRASVVYMLTVAEEQYLEAGEGAQENEAAYMISQILFGQASEMFAHDADTTVMLDLEQQSFFRDLIRAVDEKDSFVTVGTLVSAIQRDLLGTETTEARDHAAYFENIRSLYADMRVSLGEGDYDAAQEHAIEAYLENFEYLEPTLEAADAEFMYALEIEMREDLRDMIREEEPAGDILEFLDGTILPKLEQGESIAIEYLGEQSAAAQSGIALADTGRDLRAMGDTTESEQSEVRTEIDFIRDSLQDMMILYESGDYESAYATARTAYLDSYEYVEIPLRPIAPDFTLEVEYLFAELRSSIKKEAPVHEVRSLVAQIDRNLDESERLVTGTGQVAPLIAFSASFAIIFREGLEAVLILGAIMTYLEASRNKRFKIYVHYGVIAAIGATAATWFVASYVIEISGASRELIEAIAALSATAVLFYVSFWILNKIEHKKWMEFVKAKVWQATTTGSVMVFVMLSFFTVYREGFETVLFYQAMFGFAKYMEMYVGLGFVLGIGSLLAIYFVMRMMGKRLPLRVLFGLTMGIGAYLSIAFLGNAIRELQVLDIVPYTSMIGTIPRLDINMATMTGIYPTLETAIGQIVLLGTYVAASAYILIVRPRREKAIAAMRQSRKRAKGTD